MGPDNGFTDHRSSRVLRLRRPNGYRIDVSTNGFDWDKVLENNTTLALPEFSDDEKPGVAKTYHYRVFPIFASRLGPATRTWYGRRHG